MAKSNQIANSGTSVIEQTKVAIRIIRDQDVILASDVALIFGVTTKRINERAKRHPGKFPSDIMFQLTLRILSAFLLSEHLWKSEERLSLN